jgi:hypothetical protein
LPPQDSGSVPTRRGRPVVFDEAKRQAFCDFLRLGCTISKAAGLVGISRRGIHYAAKRDPQLAERIRRAQLDARMDPVTKIAGSRSWHAAAWLLERNSRHWRLPSKRDARRQAERVRRKRIRRHMRRMFEKSFTDPSTFTTDGK